MLTTLTAFLSGLLFSLGLGLSGMIQPERVQDFLDVTGAWSPMVGLALLVAIVTAMPAYYWIGRNKYKTVLRKPAHIPKSKAVNARLVAGSMILGAGWGLAGFDPGPGMVAAGSGDELAVMFVVAMLVALLLAARLEHYLARRRRHGAGGAY